MLIEPLYDSYLPIVRRAGGIPKLVRLEPPTGGCRARSWPPRSGRRTKAILLNTPMNPCRKVFTATSWPSSPSCCRKHDAYAVCDEVYEHIIFDGAGTCR